MLARRTSSCLRRAVSPAAAAVILIAVAVVAGLLVYAWVMGWIRWPLREASTQIVIRDVRGQDGYLRVEVVNVGDRSCNITRLALPYEGISYDLQPSLLLKPGESSVISVPYAWTYYRDKIWVRVITEDGLTSEVEIPLSYWDNPYAIRFEGSADRVITPDADDLDLIELTIECWVKILSYGSGWGKAPVVVKGNFSYTSFNYALLINLKYHDIEVAYTGNKHYIYSSTRLEVGKWYHVVGIIKYSGGSTYLAIYVNGELDYERTKSGSPQPNDQPLFSGANNYYYIPERKFLVDDLRIYNRTLTQEEIRDNIRGKITTDGLVLWWRFDEGSGGTVEDVSGNGHDGFLDPNAPPGWDTGISLEDEDVRELLSSLGFPVPLKHDLLTCLLPRAALAPLGRRYRG